MYMLLAYFFEPNQMETFREFNEVIFRVQMDKLMKDKGEYIM